jgi:hypothetical protein
LVASFIGGGNRSTRRKWSTCCKILTNFITKCWLWVQILWWGAPDKILCDKGCQWFVAGLWFSPVSSNNKIDCHDNIEILLKVALNTINLTLLYSGFHLSVIKRYTIKHSQQNRTNHIGDVLVTMFISDVVDCGFDPRRVKPNITFYQRTFLETSANQKRHYLKSYSNIL